MAVVSNDRELRLTLGFYAAKDDAPSNAEKTILYRFCAAHSRCGVNQFCGVKCWTGECGPDSNAPRKRAGQFCQPCEWCKSPEDAVAGSCDVCEYKGKETTCACIDRALRICAKIYPILFPNFRYVLAGLRLSRWQLLHE